MNLDDFLYHYILSGHTIMGIENKKLQRITAHKMAVEKYHEVIKVLTEYFELGLRANIFGEGGKPSGPNDRLWTGFDQGSYVYFVHRQPKRKKAIPTNMDSILNNILQQAKPPT